MHLTSDEITAMQAAADLALPETGAIYRATLSSDSMGGFTESWVLQSSPACRVDAPSGAILAEYAERIAGRQAMVINCPASTSVQAADRVIVSGVTYEVLGVLTQSWEITRRVVGVRL
jgi:hypothetical protein